MDNTPTGRGHHKRRKKGARSRFERRKNDERHRQQAGKENSPPLVANSTKISLVGFVDLGSANRDMERLIADDMADSTNGRLADHVFVFMARAVFKPTLAVPIAHYPSLNLSGKSIIQYL